MARSGRKQKIPTTSTVRFANRLKELRLARGFTKARQFADVLGILENRYTRYERGASEPDFELIYEICRKMSVTPNELFGISDLAAHPTPGFSSGPQSLPQGFSSGPQVMLESPARTHEDQRPVHHRSPHGGGATDDRGATADTPDAAAWGLAGMLVRCRTKRGPTGARASTQPLVTTTETARIYRGLKAEPFDTVAAEFAEIDIGLLEPATARDLDAAVEKFLAVMHQR